MSGLGEGPLRILRALREAAPAATSGEALSEALGVSRAQVWKHIGSLRRQGYGIEGERGGGYRLTAIPDRLYESELTHGLGTRWVGQQIEHHEEIDSTNRRAFELGRSGAPAGTTVVAEAQTAGRGRLGRNFFSPPHTNFYASVLLRPRGSIADAATLILGAGVAVAECVAETLGNSDEVEIKWPNDVLVRRRKVSGILMESSAEGAQLAFAVLGIGVNLNVDPESFPDEFRARASSLAREAGHEIDRIDFGRRLFGHLEAILEAHAQGGFDALRPRFEAFFRMRGERIGVEALGAAPLSGRALGVAGDGALELEIEQGPRAGERTRVLAGDVTLAKTPPEAR